MSADWGANAGIGFLSNRSGRLKAEFDLHHKAG